MQHVNFQKFSGGACPRTPLEPFLFLNQLQIGSAKKNTLEKKNLEIMAPPFKLSRYDIGIRGRYFSI